MKNFLFPIVVIIAIVSVMIFAWSIGEKRECFAWADKSDRPASWNGNVPQWATDQCVRHDIVVE